MSCSVVTIQSSTKVQNPRRCSRKDKRFTVKGPKTLEEIDNPDHHYPLPRLNYLVGNGRHRNEIVEHLACARMRDAHHTLALLEAELKRWRIHVERYGEERFITDYS